MNYKVLRKDNNLYDVVETKTEYVIVSNVSESEARKKSRFLNFGGGFDGWSPAFMMERIEI